MFTGSQLPIDQIGSEAVFNVGNSIKVVLQAVKEDIAEVMVGFSDKVMRASRTIKISDARFDAFDSPAFPYLARIAASQVIFSPIAFRRIKVTRQSGMKSHGSFKASIFTVDVVPGLDPKLLHLLLDSSMCEGFLLKSLGAGNVRGIDPDRARDGRGEGNARCVEEIQGGVRKACRVLKARADH